MDGIPSPHPWWGSLLSSNHVHRRDPPHNRKPTCHRAARPKFCQSGADFWPKLEKKESCTCQTHPKKSPPFPSPPPTPQAPGTTPSGPPSSTRHVACAKVGATSPDKASSSCCAAAGSPWSSTLSQSSNLSRAYAKKGAGMRGTPEGQ